MPIAEDLGLVVEIGASACADIAALPGDLEVSVNVSAVQLDAGEFAASVADTLRAAALAPQACLSSSKINTVAGESHHHRSDTPRANSGRRFSW